MKPHFANRVSLAKFLRIAVVLIFTLIYVGCSDTKGGSDEIRNRDVPPNSVGKTEDGHDVLVFQEGEIDNVLFQIDTAAVSETEGFTGKLLFKNLEEEKIPRAGDIIASGQTAVAEYGFLYKVLEVSTVNGVTAVEVRQASLEEAIEEVEFESETEFQFDEDGNLLGVLQKSGSVGRMQASRTVSIPYGDVTASVAYSMTFNFDVKIDSYKIKTAKMSLTQNGDVTLSGTLNGNINQPQRQQIASVNLPAIKFSVGPIPVWIDNALLVDLKVGGQASQADMKMEFTLNGRGEHGFEYKNGKFYPVNDNSFNTFFDFEQQVSGRVRAGVIMGLESKLYGAVGLKLHGFGPALELNVSGSSAGVHVFDNGFQNNDNEAVLDWGAEFEARVTLVVLSYSLASHTFEEEFTKFGTLHKTSALPRFNDIKVTSVGTGIEVASQIERKILNYPVRGFGVCVEINRDECRNGQGKRWMAPPSYMPIRINSKREFIATIDDLDPGQSYAIRPFFMTDAGTFYDKATIYTTYTLSVNRNQVVGGAVTPSSQQDVIPGTSVSIMATPNPGYKFVNWAVTSGQAQFTNASEASTNVTPSSNAIVTANFELLTYKLTTDNTTGGSVSVNNVISNGTTTHNYGTKITVTANPADGYGFVGWTGGLTSASAQMEITMDGDKELTANFQPRTINSYKLDISSTEGGGVERDPNLVDYTPGTSVTVTAMPNTGYHFTGWSGSATHTNNPVTIIMNADAKLTASFQKNEYILTTSAIPTGSGTVIPSGSTKHYHGDWFDIKATPANDNYTFVNWTITSGSAEFNADSTRVRLSSNATIRANFIPRFILTIDQIPANVGTITPASGQRYNSGTPIDIRAVSNSEEYKFANWTVTSGTATFADANSANTTVTLSSNATIHANFA
ncbi:MAG: InlB B-repeat-containing protein, partial [Fibromonadales bacterium]|nr:InlB B-repeat-containing protein [Fibromonadales bacterium]